MCESTPSRPLCWSTVTLVSLLVAIYSSGYMHGETGYARYFAEVALFVFSMCMLVLANNLLVLFVFWEAVGLCSYLLIGFWFSKPSASAAAKKAFVVNRIGDFALLIGLFLIWRTFGTLDLSQVLSSAAINDVLVQPGGHRTIEIICFLAVRRGSRQKCSIPIACLASGRHGRPHARQRADSCGHHGHCRGVSRGPLHAACTCMLPKCRWWLRGLAHSRRCSRP